MKTAAVILARRVHALDAELDVIDAEITPLVKAAAPELLNVYGVGADTAAVLLVTAGDNVERIATEAQWAMLCGIAPIPATSGLIVDQFRLNYAGDRHANNAIWRIVITRLGQHEPRTIAYMRRLARANRSATSSAVSSGTSPERSSKRCHADKNAVTGLAQ